MSFCPVSVVIPTYNRALLLSRAIDSVFRQTLQCSELIVVDDGSTDNTYELLKIKSSQKKIPIRVFTLENKGPGAARNFGVARAQNSLIAFLDSDDHWVKRKLEIQYRFLVGNPDYLISHTREKWLRRGVHLNQKKIHIPRQGEIFEHCLQLCAVGMSTVMMRKELFDRVGFFDETLPCCEDYDLWLRISCRYPFLLVDEPLTVKEGGREDQLSFQYRLGMDRMRIYGLRKLLDSDQLTESQHKATLQEFEKKVTIFGKGCIKHQKLEIGRHYLELISIYREKTVSRYPHLGECLNE
jgi:glycosyltransferase involved in cell wall biosynthesis